MNLLSRNTPIVLVAGAAGFLGSHLVDALLKQNLQVVGVDDLSSGNRLNLTEALNNQKFNLLEQKIQQRLPLDLERLDYAIFSLGERLDEVELLSAVEAFSKVTSAFKPKILFISSIECYGKDPEYKNLSLAERKIASHSLDGKHNARVVRLSTVFGPRMRLNDHDGLVGLLAAFINGNLEKYQFPEDFLTRALYIDDAISLLTKTLFHGMTSLKIYDGARLHPIKLIDVKQILEAALWVTHPDFTPHHLPAVPTPNLIKTQKELNWHPKTPLVSALKATVSYFKDHLPTPVFTDPETKNQEQKTDPDKTDSLEDKPIFTMDWKKSSEKNTGVPKDLGTNLKRSAYLAVAIFILTYGFFYPLFEVGWGVIGSYRHLKSAAAKVGVSDFQGAKTEVDLARESVNKLATLESGLSLVKETGLLTAEVNLGQGSVDNLKLIIEAAGQTIEGGSLLQQNLKIVSGEKDGETTANFKKSQQDFSQAEMRLSQILNFWDQDLNNQLPKALNGQLESFKTKLTSWKQQVTSGKVLATVLLEVVSGDKLKKVLVVLQNQASLKPGGGEVEGVVAIDFEAGKIKQVRVEAVSGKTLTVVNDQTSQKYSLELEELSKEADFAANAKRLEYFYQKVVGVDVEAIIALDHESLTSLVSAVGPISTDKKSGSYLTSQSLSLNSDVLGAKTDLSLQALKGIVDNLLLIPNHNWGNFSEVLASSVAQKHLLVYHKDPKILSYLTHSGWGGRFPKQTATDPFFKPVFLAVVEENSTGSNLNSRIKRQFNLETNINDSGQLSHRLSVNYDYPESSSSTYRANLRFYLSAGSQFKKALWGITDLTSQVSAFSDYGRAGYELNFDLQSQEKKSLVIDYVDTKSLEFKDGSSGLTVEVVKQPGTGQEKFDFNIKYPSSWSLETSPRGAVTSNGEVEIKTDLSEDRVLEFKFKR